MALRIGRLRVQLFEVGWDAMRLSPEANPHWSWVLVAGLVSFRWARKKPDTKHLPPSPPCADPLCPCSIQRCRVCGARTGEPCDAALHS